MPRLVFLECRGPLLAGGLSGHLTSQRFPKDEKRFLELGGARVDLEQTDRPVFYQV